MTSVESDSIFFEQHRSLHSRKEYHLLPNHLQSLDGPYVFPSQGLKAGIYQQQTKAAGPYSCLKSLSSQFYVMAGIYCRQHKWDEVLVMNTSGNLIEALSSNFFIVKTISSSTPPHFREGCINGVFKNLFYAISLADGEDNAKKKKFTSTMC